MEKRLTITDVAKTLGITPRTIMRWEKAGKIKKSKRDWRGWRFYAEEDLAIIKEFMESPYALDSENGGLVNIAKEALIVLLVATTAIASSVLYDKAHASTNFTPKNAAIKETKSSVEIDLNALQAVEVPQSLITEDIKYTLGPNDVIAIEVRRHPEFSGQYAINSEGKIEYKFVGDILVNGLTKNDLNARLTEILSEFIIEPDIDVQIMAYLSKVFYVVGDVRNPGKFYMRGNTVTVREALMQAGLPTEAAAMKGCRLITPDNIGSRNYSTINAMKLLYEGDLKENHDMKPGDVLYVPATVIAKIIRVISPVTTLTGQTIGAAASGMFLIP